MIENDLYRRLATRNDHRKPINTVNPWFPKKRQQEPPKEEYKFFHLPPNKFVSLMRNQKIAIPNDDKIRDFLKNHSLKQIVYYGDSFHQTDIKFKNPPALLSTPRSHAISHATTRQQQHSVKRRQLKIPLKLKTSVSPSQKLPTTGPVRNLSSQQDLYSKLRQLNYSPMQAMQSPLEKKIKFFEPPNTQKQLIPQELPKSVLANPPRSKKMLRVILLRALNKIKRLGVDIKYVIKNKVFSKKPYEKPLSKELIHATKKNRYQEVYDLLQINPYLVFDFDYYNMSALHWACKKGYLEIMQLLLKYHADVDAIDVLNRTALILAVSGNYREIVHELLINGAYPWSTTMSDLQTALQQNPLMQPMITKARRLQIVSNWTHHSEFLELI